MLLVASPAYPEPPIDGDKVRWSALLRPLAELVPMHGVFGYMPTPPTREARDELFERRFRGLDLVSTPQVEVAVRAGLLALQRRPSAFGRRATPRWRRAVVAAAARSRPTSILLLGTSGGYVPPWPAPTWLDLVDVRSRLRTLAGDRLTDRRVLDAELELARRHRVLLASNSDRQWLLDHGADEARIHVVPHGVDPRFLAARPARESQRLLFVGNLRYPPNRRGLDWFIRAVWPQLRDAGATLRLVGYGMERIRPTDRVEIYPNVDDVLPHYQAAAVAIAPLLDSRGTQFKALEALAARVPLVCTSPVARGFVSTQPAWEVADSGTDMTRACLALLEDPARAARLGDRGRAYIREHHDWNRSALHLCQLLTAGAPMPDQM